MFKVAEVVSPVIPNPTDSKAVCLVGSVLKTELHCQRSKTQNTRRTMSISCNDLDLFTVSSGNARDMIAVQWNSC